MKQIAQNYRSGELAVLDVPEPMCSAGGVLVRSLYSLISSGTELMKVNESKMSLVGKAKARPEQVKKVLDTVAQQGPVNAYRKAMNRLDSYTPLGYSLAGVIEAVGPGAEEFSVGQVVACAGNEFALHADVNWVPVNLCVPVPDSVAPQLAAFATVGAIALQGVRQADAQLGDTACVIGLGLVGQLVVQLLVASGVRVFGLDMVPERCRLAEKMGATLCAAPDEEGLSAIEHAVSAISGCAGADRVLLVAGGSSNGPVEMAARLARDRATVVDIGKCKLDLPWTAYYEKELDLRFSRSYGPGRYDERYEIEGIDYPVGYVRWTERRNLACFIDLLDKRNIDLEPLVSGIFPITEAVDVYERLRTNALSGVAFLFEYAPTVAFSPQTPPMTNGGGASSTSAPSSVAGARRARSHTGSLNLGFIGAGNYASTMLLPHLSRREDVRLARVATKRSLSAVNAQKKFGFAEVGTDPERVIADDTIDAVFIVTRHSSHADFVCRALAAGKAVFVEKPLALSESELERILETVDATGNDRLMVGFNRRFAPILTEMRTQFGSSGDATVARYLVNAGVLASDSWYRNEEMEGSRFAGEGGHFIDTLTWWMGADPVEVMAVAGRVLQDILITLRYTDGSLATIAYVTGGNPRFPKETFEAASGGRSARLDNFRRGTVWTGRRKRTSGGLGASDKGQRAQIDAFLQAVHAGAPMPISLSSLATTTRGTLAVSASIASGEAIRL